ncbi:MAG: GDP-mannose 4,6-dehydratase [Microthrixaceae bacterium]|nr:GDP-mannose 4,6-dehydratase [Microthrixaceae bacterium]MCB1010759.1 GDP-mannose 4,6-dehydratase [Microthrixaceae bacterium]MCO5320480.1 GDP-mannose 4,6-dehydratase [Microthrixaceae bacterium]
MRALVTGAGGFVGGHLLTHLTERGDEVITTDRSTDGLDILDAPALLDRFRQVRPEVVYHLAGASDVGGSWSTPQITFRANAEGTLNVLWAAREADVQRVLTVGSADVYGKVTPDELPLREDSPLRPTSPYAASKVAAESVAQQAFLGFGQQVVRVRPFNHLGPGQSTRFVAPALAERIAQNERDGAGELRVGNLSSERDFTDVRDVVRAYRLLVDQGRAGEVYNVCSGRAIAVSELAEAMLELSRVDQRLVEDPELQRPVDIPVLLGDASRLNDATGWAPEIPLGQTLADLLDNMRSRLG